MPIPLVMDGDSICWPDGRYRDRTPKLSSEDMRQAIIRSAGQYLPSRHLASFRPSDVVVATDGPFWITPASDSDYCKGRRMLVGVAQRSTNAFTLRYAPLRCIASGVALLVVVRKVRKATYCLETRIFRYMNGNSLFS